MNTAGATQDVSLESLVAQLADEFVARLERGERPDVEEYLARYPQHAAVIRNLLASLQFIRLSAADASATPAAPTGPTEPEAPLGDFRIVREVGRGGMGVVYEAVQISLGRRVALKVLPFAAALDPRQLQRFKNEAQAAAHLHHTNIVPVYGVGCERGVHYYAMQFIEGHTLAAMIHELRQLAGLDAPPTEGLGAAAQPMAHDLVSGRWAPAQRRHADPELTGPYTPSPLTGPALHPATPLTSGQSARGQAFFRTAANLGVQTAQALEHAHQLGVIHRDIKPANLLVDERGNLWVTDFGLAHCQSQAGLTMTGDLLGTLRYMSPEQVLARRVLVDHRTDVYSLGVTLYELLTLEPAFAGTDRAALLRQIAFEEPRPPRQLNRGIPAELETIVLQAVAKNPAERYATAQELADDLERFLQNKPIHARRPSMVQKVWKWSRRHQAVVLTTTALTMAFLMLAVALLWLGYSRIRQEGDAKDAALSKAEDSAWAAKESARDARQAVDRYYTTVSESTLFDTPAMQPLRQQLLEDALQYYERFLLRRPADDPGLEESVALARFRVWQIFIAMNRQDEAMVALGKGLDVVEKLYGQRPNDTELYKRLAGFRKGRFLFHRAGQFESAEANIRTLQRAGRFWERLARQHPAVAEFQLNLAETYSDIALYLWAVEGTSPADEVAAYQKAYAIWKKLALENPASLEYQECLARGQVALGSYLRKAGRFQEAANVIQQGLRFAEAMAAGRPHVYRYREAVAEASQWLVRVYAQAHQYEKAEKAFAKADDCVQRLATEFPNSPSYPTLLVLMESARADMFVAAGRFPDAEKAARHRVALSEKLVDDFPSQPTLKWTLAMAHRQLGRVLRAAGRGREAIGPFRQALSLFRDMALKEGPGRQGCSDLAATYSDLVQQLQANGESPEAQEVARQASAIYERLAASFPSGPHERHYQAEAQRTLGHAFRSANMPAEAEQAYRQAVALHEALVAEHADEVSYREGLVRDCVELAEFLQCTARRQEAQERCREAIAVHEKLAAEFPQEVQYRQALFSEYYLLAQMGNIQEAERGYRKLLALDPTNALAHNNLARLLATCPDPKVRNASWAVELARKAVELEPKQGSWWNTLGAARYRAGDPKAAIDALTKAMELRQGGDSSDWFFLAMAHWQLGHKEEARNWYDQAVAWMRKNKPHDEELRRFRSEAEETLGLKGHKQ
jgi:serine/threonine protein kinase/Flp pilus assembly protein TadD